MALVIFDCDGVLVDSEPISIAVLREIISEAGITIDESMAYRRFLGRSLASVSEILEREFGLEAATSHLSRMRDRLYGRLREDLRAIPGIAAALRGLKGPFCVASSSQPERIRLSLEVTGLLETFEPHIYSSTMVRNGKPAPDLFLYAAQSMGADPTSCTVIEDSSAGVEAAKRAGMHVFAFVGGSHAASGGLRQSILPHHPDLVFDDMRQLPDLLRGSTRES